MEYNYKEAMKLDNQLCFPIYAAVRAVTSAYTPFLKPLGLTYTQYILFLVLWEKDGLTVGEICKRLMLDSGTLSPVLKKLRQQGYIEKRQSTADERSFIITLTEKGECCKKRQRISRFRSGNASISHLKKQSSSMICFMNCWTSNAITGNKPINSEKSH